MARLGYPAPPFTVTITGPTALASGEPGTWMAHGHNGSAPYSYTWAYHYACAAPPPPPDPCTYVGGVPLCTSAPLPGEPSDEPVGAPLAPPVEPAQGAFGPPNPGSCGVWNAGPADMIFTETFYRFPVTVRVTAGDSNGATAATARSIYGRQNFADGGGDALASSPDGDAALTTGASVAPGGLPTAFALADPRPNPFTASAVLVFDLPEPSPVRLAVYDALGREVAVVADGVLEAGSYAPAFDGRDLPAGVYVVRLQAGAFTATRRMTLTR